MASWAPALMCTYPLPHICIIKMINLKRECVRESLGWGDQAFRVICLYSTLKIREGYMMPCPQRPLREHSDKKRKSDDGATGNKMTPSDHGTPVCFEFQIGLLQSEPLS